MAERKSGCGMIGVNGGAATDRPAKVETIAAISKAGSQWVGNEYYQSWDRFRMTFSRDLITDVSRVIISP